MEESKTLSIIKQLQAEINMLRNPKISKPSEVNKKTPKVNTEQEPELSSDLTTIPPHIFNSFLQKNVFDVEFSFPRQDVHCYSPIRSSPGAVGYDLFSTTQPRLLVPGECALFPLNLKLKFKNYGLYAQIVSRSGLACKRQIKVVGSGIIDPDFKGPIAVWLKNDSTTAFRVDPGMRICQLIFHPFHQVNLIQEATEINNEGENTFSNTRETPRDDAGFGSSGLY